MKPESDNGRSKGEFVRMTKSLPPVKVDCSGWDCAAGPRSTGEFVHMTKSMPPIKVDCSGWGRASQLYLECDLTLAPDTDPVAVLARVIELVNRLHEYETSLGGAGLTWDKERSSAKPGRLLLILRPNDSAGAEDRLRKLAELVVQTLAGGPAIASLRCVGYREESGAVTLLEVAA
jgi:hypothetical protein